MVAPGGLQWQTNTNWGLYQASWRFRLAPWRTRDINRQHILPPVIFSEGSSGFQSFPFFLNSTPAASSLFVKAAHARARRILSQFCFSSKFDFQKIAAPAVANWRCQFAKFSSRVQIEPNARMLVNVNTKIPQSSRLWFVKSRGHVKHLRQRGWWLARVLSGAVAACLFVS